MTDQTAQQPTDAYLALMGRAPKRIPHWEHLSNPDFIAGIKRGVQALNEGRITPWEDS